MNSDFRRERKVLTELTERVIKRRDLLAKMAELSKSEAAKAIYSLSVELCELENLIIILIARLK